MFQRRLPTSPSELLFSSISANTEYSQELQITNQTISDQEITLKACPTIDRDYQITPSEFTLPPKSTKLIKISLYCSRPGTFRDVIHLITPTFSEKVYINLTAHEPPNSHFQDLVKEKDDQLQSSQSRIDRLEEELEELNEKLRQTQLTLLEKDRVEQELARVQQENTEFRSIIEEFKRNEVFHNEFKELVNEKVPSLNSLIELTLRQEQEKHERKNQKILEILQIKDSLIEDLEDKCEELNNALTLMQHKLNDNKVLLNNAEKSWQGAQKVIEDLKTANYEKDQIILSFKQKGINIQSSLQEDPKILKSELIKNFDQINQLTLNLQRLEQENSKLREREEYVLELSKRQGKIREDHEKLLKEKDFIISDLKGKVSMQTEHIESLANKLSSSNYPEILNKLSSLEEENRILSKRLAESQNSSLTFKQEDLDDNKLSILETENEKLQISLKEFTGRSQVLEKELFEKNREIINLQNEIIEYKKFKSEMILKAAPSPQDDLIKLASSLRQEQSKVHDLESLNDNLTNKVKKLELTNEELNAGFQNLCESLESGNFDLNSQNQLLKKINSKLKTLKDKEEDAIRTATLAEEGLKILQNGLGLTNTTDLLKDLRKMQSELVQAKSKNDFLTATNQKLKEDLEEKVKILTSLQFLSSNPEKPSNKKLRKRTKIPPKIIKALLDAKIGEAEAVKKLRMAAKFEQDLRSQVQTKEETIRKLKNDLQTGTFVPSSESSSGRVSEFDENIQKKLLKLEFELNELKEQEMNSWESFRPLSLASHKDPQGKGFDDFEVLIEGILYLVDQIAFGDSEGRTDTVEKAQRIVIRALSRAVQADDEKFEKFIGFVPSREEDRNVWYLEILEQHFRTFSGFVGVFGESISKLTGENGGSVAVNAGFKGLYLELTKSAKSLMDEISVIQMLCQLVKSDCQKLSKSPNITQDLNNIFSLEIEKACKSKSEEISIQKKENQKLRSELDQLQQKLELTLTDFKSVQGFLSQLKSKSSKLEQEKLDLQKAVESLCQELKEETKLKDQALLRVEKLHQDLKDWQQAQIEILTDRERTIIDLQSQIKSLREEQLGALNENLDMVREKSDNHSDELLLQELNSLQQQNSELQKKVFELNKNLIDDKQSYLARIAELEESSAYSFKYKDQIEESPGCYTLKKDPSIQLASLQALLREKISALDEETRKRIESDNKLRSILLTESAAEQKMSKMEKEFISQISSLHTQLENSEKCLSQMTEERDLAMLKFMQLTESLKISTESLRKAESEINSLQEAQKTQVSKYNTKLKTSDSASITLKTQLKDLSSQLDSLKQENEALHDHLKSLEKEFEVTSMQLEDSEKVNTSLKYKLKDYEQKIEDLEEMRVMESNGNSSRYEQIRLELKLTYEEFEKTAEMYEGQIAYLKEVVYADAKKKGKKPAETVDFLMQLSKKESIIRALRAEVKAGKGKKGEKKVKKFDNASAEEEIVMLQNQNCKLKAQVKSLEVQVQGLRDEVDKVSQGPKIVESTPKRDIQEIERRHRQDLQKLAEEVARLREKWHSPEEWAQIQAANRELEQSIRRLTDELSRKKDILENLKAIKDQQDSENNIIQEELEQAKDYSEKMKKLRNELGRKEKIIFELKSSLEASKESEKKVMDDNYSMAEKIKSLKNEVNRKDALIKDFKAKSENLSQENWKNMAEEVESLKDKLKKVKSDCERKDLQVKNFKSKLETAEIELETLQAEKQNLSTDAFANLEKELRKNERLLAQLRKTEAQFQSLCGITRKIFKELGESVEGFRGKSAGGIDKEYYSDCMSILNMDMKDLSEFVGQRSVGTTLCRIERLLEQGEDTGEILQIFSQLLEERLDLERNSRTKRVEKSKSTKFKGN